MTSNQVQYWRNQEEIRANQAKERENARQREETIRANKAKEAENKRHNEQQEAIARIENALRARGLDQDEIRLLLQDAETMGKYGTSYGLNSLYPTQKGDFGTKVDWTFKDGSTGIAETIRGTIRDWFGSRGVLGTISEFF